MAANKDVPAKERFAAAIAAWNAGAARRDAAKRGAQNRKEAKERIADRLATRKERLEQERAERHDPEKEQARRGCIQEALHDAMGFKERGAHMYLRGCNFEPVLDIERWVEATGCGTMPLVGPL